MKKFFYINIFIYTILIGNTIMAETTYKKPYYGIKLDLAQVGVDIRLNDIPIYYDDTKGQLTVDLPAPSSVINGDNELKIIAFPPFIDDENKMEKFLPGSEVNATLYVQEYDDQDNKKEILTSISIKFNDKSKVDIVDTNNDFEKANIKSNTTTKAIVTRSVKINSGFPQWEWESGKLLTNTKENFSTLLQAYKEIYSSFKNKNTDNVFRLYNNRAKEVSIAYHLNNISDGHTKISTGEDMNDPDLKLHDFWDQNMMLDIYANGKMARIVDQDNDQPILFVDKDSGTLHLHKFGFYKNKNNKWIMIR